MPVLRDLYDSLVQPRALSPEEVPYGEFLREQGALSWSPPVSPRGLVFETGQPGEPGLYEFGGDGEGGAWRYFFQPGQSACLTCLFRNWLERFHPAEWWERIQDWPDFRLSWPAAESLPEAPVLPGWLHYQKGSAEYRGRVFSRFDCNCLPEQRFLPHWGSWSHPVSGPLTQVVERRRRGLWRVSVHLHQALASGAHREKRKARRAAVGEACERWAALQTCNLPRVRVRSLNGCSSRTCWSGLVFLGDIPDSHGQQLSHGLACGPSFKRALRAGFWELLERDALRRWWQDWKAGRPVTGLQRHARTLWSLPGGVFLAFVGRDGKGAWGSAAGPEAEHRAVREARQNYQILRRQAPAAPVDCLSFQDHAAWAWHHCLPRWEELEAMPLSARPEPVRPSTRGVYYYRFDCPWAERLGWTVVKVLSPRLRGLPIGGEPPFHPFS